MHTEFSFLWPINDASCLEGVIDFVAIDPDAGKCFLLDWKTNQVRSGKADSLRLRYLPQIAAYWKAVSEITRYEVEAGLFSTAAGKLLKYEAADLKKEWNRLENIPPQRLEEEIRFPNFD